MAVQWKNLLFKIVLYHKEVGDCFHLLLVCSLLCVAHKLRRKYLHSIAYYLQSTNNLAEIRFCGFVWLTLTEGYTDNSWVGKFCTWAQNIPSIESWLGCKGIIESVMIHRVIDIRLRFDCIVFEVVWLMMKLSLAFQSLVWLVWCHYWEILVNSLLTTYMTHSVPPVEQIWSFYSTVRSLTGVLEDYEKDSERILDVFSYCDFYCVYSEIWIMYSAISLKVPQRSRKKRDISVIKFFEYPPTISIEIPLSFQYSVVKKLFS